jgi:hypothetical protein
MTATATTSKNPMNTYELIRAGDPDLEELQPYKERFCREKRVAEEILKSRILFLRATKRILFDWKKAAEVLNMFTVAPEQVEGHPAGFSNMMLTCFRFNASILVQYESGIDEDENEGEFFYNCLNFAHSAQENIRELVLPLFDAASHWNSSDGNVSLLERTKFLMSQWLAGATLPPKCSVDRCDSCALPPLSPFCADHSCEGCLRDGIAIRSANTCTNHLCQFRECSTGVVLKGQRYCMNHLCTKCGELGGVGHPMVAEGLNYCRYHMCSYRGVNCRNSVFLPTTTCCEQHLCRACFQIDELSAVAVPNSFYCFRHMCAADGCRHRSLDLAGASFCSSHSCRVCVQLDTPIKSIAIGPVPRNVCALHPLCSQCNEIAIDMNTLTCVAHSDTELKQVQCNGQTKAKKRCGTKGKSLTDLWYCPAHSAQAEVAVVVVVEDDPEIAVADEVWKILWPLTRIECSGCGAESYRPHVETVVWTCAICQADAAQNQYQVKIDATIPKIIRAANPTPPVAQRPGQYSYGFTNFKLLIYI